MNNQLKHYQLTCFFSPLLDQKQLNEVIEKIKKWIEDNEGKAEKEKITKKNLAYKIKNFQDAFFVLLNFNILPEKISELTNKLKSESDILRYLIVVLKQTTALSASQKKSLKREKNDLVEELIIEKQKEMKKSLQPPAPEISPSPEREKINLEDLNKKLDEILNE